MSTNERRSSPVPSLVSDSLPDPLLLRFARQNGLDRFYVAYAYEASARAVAVAGQRRARNRYLREARGIGEGVRDRDDRRMLLEDLATVP